MITFENDRIKEGRIVESFGPEWITAGQTFNSSNDGLSAFWVQTTGPLGRPFVILNGLYDYPITPAYDPQSGLLTFEIVTSLTNLVSQLTFQIIDLRLAIKSEEHVVEIQGNQPVESQATDVISGLIELSFVKSNKYTFSGWGMKSQHCVPWTQDPVNCKLLSEYRQKITGEFETGFPDLLTVDGEEGLLWRASILDYFLTLAIQNNKSGQFNAVECGVGDGLSAYSIMHRLKWYGEKLERWHVYLCDLWGDAGLTLEGEERSLEGTYSRLSIERTIRNLKRFSGNYSIIQGILPCSISDVGDVLEPLGFVHIDLNFSKPTLDCAEKLFPKLKAGGVMLFDDYGWSPHEQTRAALESFLPNKGTFMMMPTGQAALIKDLAR